MYRLSKIDVSTFGDGFVDLQRPMNDVSIVIELICGQERVPEGWRKSSMPCFNESTFKDR